MNKWSTILFVFLVLSPASLVAIEPADFKRILIPIADLPVDDYRPGGHGTEWVVSLLAINTSSSDVLLFQTPGCSVECEFPTDMDVLPAGEVRSLYTVTSLANPSSLFYVEPEHEEAVRFALHSRDASRQIETSGVEIPVVHEDELLTGRVDLLHVPIDPTSRVHLRAYDPFPEIRTSNGRGAHRFTVSFYELGEPPRWESASEPVLVETIHAVEGVLSRPFPASASVATMLNLETLPGISPNMRYRIVIESEDPAARIWAFVTLTNNLTQHVTTVTPQ